MQTHTGTHSFGKRRAFTLVEILIALSIGLLVLAGTFTAYFFTSKTFAMDMGRTLVNRDIRTLRNELVDDVAYCNRLEVYNSYSTRTKYTDSNGNISGNFILCITEIYDETDKVNKIDKVVGYYQGAADAAGQTPLYRFAVKNCNAAVTTNVLTLIPATSGHKERITNCVGLNPGGKIFRNYMNSNAGISVFARMVEKGAVTKTASGSMYFTVVRRS